MSSKSDENPANSKTVDVDDKTKEDARTSDKTCDSAFETSVSCSDTLSTLSTGGVSSPELTGNQVLAYLSIDPDNSKNTDSNRILPSVTSISLDINKTSECLLNLDELTDNPDYPVTISDTLEEVRSTNLETDNHFSLGASTSDLIVKKAIETTESSTYNLDNDLQNQEIKNLNENQKLENQTNSNIMESDKILTKNSRYENKELHDIMGSNNESLDCGNNLQNENERKITVTPDLSAENLSLESNRVRNLTTSTISLNEQNTDNINSNISKSLSKSAENISFIPSVTDTDNLNSRYKDLNKEKILNEFVNQKTKAVAMQKLSPEIKNNSVPQHILDPKYSRLPKELLPQDLGSLVKNVHGIFSSVSGSLKYAYNQTQKAPKPHIKNIARPIPNGKLMDDIFEDDSEKILESVHQNGVEKFESSSKNSLQYSDTKKEEENFEGKEINDDCKKLQSESSERVLAELRKENAMLRERVKQQVDELHNRDQTLKEFELKLDLMSKRVDQADREKDAAVMRYASVECAAIEAKRTAEKAALAEKAAITEMELMSTKLKSAWAEKQRICQLYDDKCHELSNSAHELAKVREDLKELEGRLKWTQSKLRMEMDAYKESSERADRLAQQVTELEAAKEAAATNATDSARAKLLEQELKESQAALILCRHEKEDLERRLASTSQLLDTCKKERDIASTTLASTAAEVERLKECNLRLEEEAAELAALRAQAALADTLTAQLHRESERAAQAEEALSSERARAETCALREAAALQHAARLTAQHVQQRAQSADTSNKVQALEVENESLRERISCLEHEVSTLQSALSEEADRRNKETRALARKVAEITEEVTEANKKLEWEVGENGVLKKKHANAIKELNRELHRALKRCEQLEAKLSAPEANIRTGSISSLSSGESAAPPAEDNIVQNGHAPDSLPDIQVREPDRQALIERIVSLQRAAARRAERCEFLEEHARQLTSELRGKARLLRHLLCSLPAGAVASSERDAHKKEIARLGGGAMAAVWGGEATGMTLDLSLEMNNKLQAVLEDALLKNITLKENMDTLGEEIARLKEKLNHK